MKMNLIFKYKYESEADIFEGGKKKIGYFII